MSTDYGNSQGGAFLAAATPGAGRAANLPIGYNKMTEQPAAGVALPGQLERAAARYLAKYRQGQSRAIYLGDSWGTSQGASLPANSAYNLTKAAAGSRLLLQSYAQTGKTIVEYQRNSLADGSGAATVPLHQAAIDDIIFGIWGLNDIRGIAGEAGNNPARFPQMQKRAQAVATWVMVPEAARVRMHTADNSGANPAASFVNTWTHTGFANNPNFSYTQTAGASVEFTTPVGDMLVIRFGIDAASTGLWQVQVDGAVIGTVSSLAAYNGWSLSCQLFRLPTNQAHRVKLTLLSGDVMMIDSVDCVDTTKDFSATLLYSGPGYLLDATNSGWSDAGGTANGAVANSATGALAYLYGNGGADRFAASLDEAMTGLFELGFNVVNCRARVGFDPTVHTSSGDRVHPNDLGHYHLYQSFWASINYLLPI